MLGRLTRRAVTRMTAGGILIALGSACQPVQRGAPGAAPAADTSPIKIGTLFDYTGDLASYGGPIRNGTELAAKHINDAGGLLGGRKIQLVHKDSQTSPQAAVEAARALVNVDKVPAIVGSLASSVTLAVAEAVAIPNRVVLISPASTSPALTALNDQDFVFRTAPSDALQGVILAKVAWEQGFRKAAVLYVNNPYGQGLNNVFKREFERLGGQVTANVPHEQVQPSYEAELRRAAEGKPDVLVCVSYPDSASIYLRQAIEGKYFEKFLFTDGTKAPELIQKVGAQYLNGMYGTAPGAVESEAKKIFNEAYRSQFGELPPKPYIAEAYDALVLIGLAIQKAGKAEGPAIRDNLRFVANAPGEKVGPGLEGIKKALDLLRQGRDIHYQGASGIVGFDDKGDPTSGAIEVWKIENGQIVTVRTETL
jgi:branched-chain amino acid transport system substrate-binding protein